MKNRLDFLFVIFAVMLVGCGGFTDRETVAATLRKNVQEDIPCAKEFMAVCPEGDVSIYLKKFNEDNSTAELRGVVHDRYVLMFQVKFQFDSKTLRATRSNLPSITFDEIVSVEGKPEGPVKLKHGKHFKISPSQWQKIVESKWNFSAAGIQIETNAPVAGIEILKTYFKNNHAE